MKFKPKTLADALRAYQKALLLSYSCKRAEEIYRQTVTAIIRHTLPGLGLKAFKGRKPTKAELENAWKLMEKLPLETLLTLISVQQQVFERFGVSKASQYTYKSRTQQFGRWTQTQSWHPQPLGRSFHNRSPQHRHGHGAYHQHFVTNRIIKEPYKLKDEDRPPHLVKEVEELRRFLGSEYCPSRPFPALAPATIETYLQTLWRIFGELHYHRGVPKEELSLNLLVRHVPLKDVENPLKARQDAEKATRETEALLCEHFDFLYNYRQIQSHGTALQVVNALNIIARYQYRDETYSEHYDDIPVVRNLRKYFEDLIKKNKQAPPVSIESRQWLDLPDVLEQIVNPLRLECGYRTQQGCLRNISAITRSFQIFIIFALLTFRPPRRQRVVVNLKMALSCPIKRPSNVNAEQLIHPLPAERRRDKTNSYLHKSSDGVWYIDLMPESYKTGKIYGAQSLAIPNPVFDDGHCFYDYLEAYLYGYFRDPEGYWQSGGQLAYTPNTPGQWHSLRLALQVNPEFDYVFFKPTVKKNSIKAVLARWFGRLRIA